MAKIRRYFIIQHIDNKAKFEEKILSTSFSFLHFLVLFVKMLKFTSIVGYTSCGPTYIESFLTIFGQCIKVLNYNACEMAGILEDSQFVGFIVRPVFMEHCPC